MQLSNHLTADEMRMVLPRRPLKPRTFRIGGGQVRCAAKCHVLVCALVVARGAGPSLPACLPACTAL